MTPNTDPGTPVHPDDCFRTPGSAVVLARALDRLSRDQLEHLCERNLQNLLAKAKAVPWLEQSYPGLAGVCSPEDFPRLRPLSPVELSEGSPPESLAYRFSAADEPGLTLSSSGTTGREKFLYHSWPFNDQVRFLGARGIRAALADAPPRRVLNCSTFCRLSGSGIFIHELGQHLGVRTYPLGADFPSERAVAVIVRHEIDTIVASPRALLELVETAPPNSLRSLRNVLYQAAAMSDGLAQTLQSQGLNVRAASYSATETGPIGYQCPRCDPSTYHIHEDALLVEIVDPSTFEPLEPGASGEVLVTSYSDTGMVLLRYRVGDRGRFLPGECPCGSQARRLCLEGRTEHSINLMNGALVSDFMLLRLLEPIGLTSTQQLQLVLEWSGPRFVATLRVDEGRASSRDPDQVRALLLGHDKLSWCFIPPMCTSVKIEFCRPTDFYRTAAGKSPSLHQIFSGQPGGEHREDP